MLSAAMEFRVTAVNPGDEYDGDKNDSLLEVKRA